MFPAAPGATAKLRTTSLCSGSEPPLPPVSGDLQGCALHLPARYRGHFHGDHSNQNRQVGLQALEARRGQGRQRRNTVVHRVSCLAHMPKLLPFWQSQEVGLWALGLLALG